MVFAQGRPFPLEVTFGTAMDYTTTSRNGRYRFMLAPPCNRGTLPTDQIIQFFVRLAGPGPRYVLLTFLCSREEETHFKWLDVVQEESNIVTG